MNCRVEVDAILKENSLAGCCLPYVVTLTAVVAQARRSTYRNIGLEGVILLRKSNDI